MAGNTRGVVGYVLIAYGLAWIAWEFAIRLGGNLTGSPLAFQVLALPGAFAPAIACIVVRKWITREGFGDAGLRPNLGRGWPYYLAGWLLPLPVVVVILLVAPAMGQGSVDWTLASALQRLAPGAPASTASREMVYALPFSLLLNALIFTPVLWGEEFGWRGYLQLRLYPGRPLLAAIATGVVWSLWHLPLNLRGYNFPGYPAIGMVVFTVSTILLSIIFGWLRLRTGSVWAPSLAHSATNAVGSSMVTVLFATGNPLFISYLGILSWIPLGALCLWLVLSGKMGPRTTRALS